MSKLSLVFVCFQSVIYEIKPHDYLINPLSFYSGNRENLLYPQESELRLQTQRDTMNLPVSLYQEDEHNTYDQYDSIQEDIALSGQKTKGKNKPKLQQQILSQVILVLSLFPFFSKHTNGFQNRLLVPVSHKGVYLKLYPNVSNIYQLEILPRIQLYRWLETTKLRLSSKLSKRQYQFYQSVK